MSELAGSRSARRSYWAPRETPPDKPNRAAASAGGGDGRHSAHVRAAARATAALSPSRHRQGRHCVALGVRLPALAGRTPESVDLLIKAFTADNEAASDNPVISSRYRPHARMRTSRYILARVTVPKPGRRIAVTAHSDLVDTRGSVYVDVEVSISARTRCPSGVIVNAIPGAVRSRPAALQRPDVRDAATERAFATTDIVTTSVRVYQGASEKVTACR